MPPPGPATALGVAVLAVLCLASCGQPEASRATPGLGPRLDLPEAADRDPAPGAVSVKLVARPAALEIVPGHSSALRTYSGTLPGPLIRAKKGDHLRVDLENELDEPTTIHWHGVRVPNSMDGVPDMTQPAVAPGGAFSYDFTLPDAGTFWYHPHFDSTAQLGDGLYGVLLVEDPDEPADIGDEVVLVLSDVSLDQNGVAVVEPVDTQSALAGREGETVLVNGRVYPTLQAQNGRRQRWRVLNASRSRYFRLGLPGHQFLKIGGDGGLSEYPVVEEEPVIVPGARLDLVLEPRGEAGASLDLMALPISRGLPLAESEARALVRVLFTEPEGRAQPALPDISRSQAPIDTANAESVAIALTMSEDSGEVQMGINGVPFSASQPISARVGSVQILAVENRSPYAHPFHLHGFFFQPLDESGRPRHPLALTDTIDIPPFSAQNLAVSYDDRPGMWMFHCHILDHADAGMMGMLHVLP